MIQKALRLLIMTLPTGLYTKTGHEYRIIHSDELATEIINALHIVEAGEVDGHPVFRLKGIENEM